MDKYRFKIYLVEKSPGSQDLINRITSLFNRKLRNNYSLEIIDIIKNPEVAVKNDILASPTLLKEHPLPSQRIIGNIKDEKTLITMLNLANTDDI